MTIQEEEPHFFYTLRDNAYKNVYLKAFKAQGIFNLVKPVWTTDVSEAVKFSTKEIAIQMRYLLIEFCPNFQVVMVTRTFANYTYREHKG